MAVEKEEVKKYLYIDGSHQDDVIEELIKSAEIELYLSGVDEFNPADKQYPLYRLAIMIIVARHFEDRSSMEKPGVNLDYIISKLAVSSGGDVDAGLQQAEK